MPKDFNMQKFPALKGSKKLEMLNTTRFFRP